MFRYMGLVTLVFLVQFLGLKSANSFTFKAAKRSHIQIVGSSTVYPFTSVIAEEFGRNSKFRTPIVEATGTGGGMKLFCSGIGYNYPDFVNASRAVKNSEIKRCAKNNITQIIEIKIGYDGIVLANSKKGEKYFLTKKQIFLALADKVPNKEGKLVENFYQKWSDVDKNLPNINIAVYGPPPTSGTRDAFVELVMEKPCAKMAAFKKAHPNKKLRKKKCHLVRNDGKFIEAGENDNLIIQKLRNDHDALGIFGFSFLEENHDILQAANINKVEANFKNITSGKYSVSRPLFVYYKGEHIGLIEGMKEFILEIISTDTIGTDGYLLQKGLIPLTDLELKAVRNKVIRNLGS